MQARGSVAAGALSYAFPLPLPPVVGGHVSFAMIPLFSPVVTPPHTHTHTMVVLLGGPVVPPPSLRVAHRVRAVVAAQDVGLDEEGVAVFVLPACV